MEKAGEIKPFNNCPALDGCHCQSSSLAKVFHYHGHPLSEDMLLGLGAGMGFIYWKMKMGSEDFVFIGGRGNTKEFFSDLGMRTGVEIDLKMTTSVKRAEKTLLEKLLQREPVMVFGDMGYLPWFELPDDYHFGGHTFVVCGYDGGDSVLASDIDQKATGLKKGFYYPITLERLGEARGSKHKPFPPKNAYLELDFKNFRDPGKGDIYSAIEQACEAQLDPPIKNIGIKGIRHTAKELPKWRNIFEDEELRMNLFSLYIFIEIGGTGGGCFRYMYSRFLEESAEITGNKELSKAAERLNESGKLFSEIGESFRDAELATDLEEKIETACGRFEQIAEIEDDVFNGLSEAVQK